MLAEKYSNGTTYDNCKLVLGQIQRKGGLQGYYDQQVEDSKHNRYYAYRPMNLPKRTKGYT